MDYPLHCLVLSLTWTPTPYRVGFTIAKPYKRTFSSFCGHYCVYFILLCCRGVPSHAIVSDFISNLTENGRSISRFIRDVSQHRLYIYCLLIKHKKTHQGVLVIMSTFRFFVGSG